MPGNVAVTQITNITKTALSFIIPNNVPDGYITVKSIYGSGRSKFQYKDQRNILFGIMKLSAVFVMLVI